MDDDPHGAPGRAELAPELLRERFERALIEADRMILQIVQASLQLIGFGFTLYAFVAQVVDPVRFSNVEAGARRLGLSFQAIGLILLVGGIIQQSLYRRRLWRRSHLYSRAVGMWRGARDVVTPCYLSAVLLLASGVMAMGSIILKRVALD